MNQILCMISSRLHAFEQHCVVARWATHSNMLLQLQLQLHHLHSVQNNKIFATSVTTISIWNNEYVACINSFKFRVNNGYVRKHMIINISSVKIQWIDSMKSGGGAQRTHCHYIPFILLPNLHIGWWLLVPNIFTLKITFPYKAHPKAIFVNNAIHSFVRSFIEAAMCWWQGTKLYLCTYAQSVYELQANVSILIMNFKLKCFPNDYGE